MPSVLIDDEGTVKEIITRRVNDNGKPLYHPKIMKMIVDVPEALPGWKYDKVTNTCVPPVIVTIDPALEKAGAIDELKSRYLLAMLARDRQLATAIELEYASLVSSKP